MGWSAATYGCGGSIFDPSSIFLGSSLFLWQFPHFFALNWMYREDYRRGGFEMVSVNDPDGGRTAALITNYSVLLSLLPLIAVWENLTSSMFLVEVSRVLRINNKVFRRGGVIMMILHSSLHEN